MRLFRQISEGEKYNFCTVKAKIKKGRFILFSGALTALIIGIVWGLLL